MGKYSSNKIRKTQNEHPLSKFDGSVVVDLKPISYFLVLIPFGVFFLKYWTLDDR